MQIELGSYIYRYKFDFKAQKISKDIFETTDVRKDKEGLIVQFKARGLDDKSCKVNSGLWCKVDQYLDKVIASGGSKFVYLDEEDLEKAMDMVEESVLKVREDLVRRLEATDEWLDDVKLWRMKHGL